MKQKLIAITLLVFGLSIDGHSEEIKKPSPFFEHETRIVTIYKKGSCLIKGGAEFFFTSQESESDWSNLRIANTCQPTGSNHWLLFAADSGKALIRELKVRHLEDLKANDLFISENNSFESPYYQTTKEFKKNRILGVIVSNIPNFYILGIRVIEASEEKLVIAIRYVDDVTTQDPESGFIYE